MKDDIDPYLRQKRIELGRVVLSRKRIYLDTNYWIGLRDASLGRVQCSGFKLLADMLGRAVADGRIVCPLSPAIYIELMAQQDRVTRLATAKVIDRLSDGVAMQSRDLQFQAQVLHFIRCPAPRATFPPFQLYLWTRVGYALGDLFPSNDRLPPDVLRDLGRRYDDRMWKTPLAAVIEAVGNRPPRDLDERKRFVAELNKGTQEHSTECSSFQRLLRSELAGVLGDQRAELGAALDYVSQTEGNMPWTTDEREEAGRQLSNILFYALARRRIWTRFPGIIVPAVLHAAVRWDRQRRLNSNDLWDFEHAAMALGLCSAMFTDAGLERLVTSYKLDVEFGVPVLSNIDAVVDYTRAAITA